MTTFLSSGGVGVVQLWDEYGVTGDKDTRIRIRHSKRDKVRVTACCQDLGERRILSALLY